MPSLRPELEVSDVVHATGESLVVIRDPTTGKTLQARGFELSIARMVNGRRTAGEIVEAAQHIGMPLTLQGLSAFIRKLRGMGFLHQPGVPAPEPQENKTWPPRPAWSAEIRERYQTALREARLDELQAAKGHLEELLAASPDLTDAKELLEYVNQHLEAVAAGAPQKPFLLVFSEVEKQWPEEDPDLPKPRGKLVAAVALVVAGAGVAFFPFQHTPVATYELSPASIEVVKAPRVGVVLAVVEVGRWVEAGAEVARLGEPQQKRLAEAKARLAAAQTRVEALRQSAPVAARAVDDWKAAKGPKALKAARAAVLAITGGEQLLEAEEALPRAQREVDAAHREAPAAKDGAGPHLVHSTKAGFARRCEVKVGDAVDAGRELCTLIDTQALEVKLSLSPGTRGVAPGQVASLEIEGKRATATLTEVDGPSARARLDNASGNFKPGGKGKAKVAAGRLPLVFR